MNVHVFSPRYAEEEIERNLYATTKRELSTRGWRYVRGYTEAKSEVVKQILARANP